MPPPRKLFTVQKNEVDRTVLSDLSQPRRTGSLDSALAATQLR